jgi:hypothetical protein
MIRTPHLCLPDPLDEVPADTHGISGPSVKSLREEWTGLAPSSRQEAEKSRQEAAETKRLVGKAATELREAYIRRNAGRPR